MRQAHLPGEKLGRRVDLLSQQLAQFRAESNREGLVDLAAKLCEEAASLMLDIRWERLCRFADNPATAELSHESSAVELRLYVEIQAFIQDQRSRADPYCEPRQRASKAFKSLLDIGALSQLHMYRLMTSLALEDLSTVDRDELLALESALLLFCALNMPHLGEEGGLADEDIGEVAAPLWHYLRTISQRAPGEVWAARAFYISKWVFGSVLHLAHEAGLSNAWLVLCQGILRTVAACLSQLLPEELREFVPCVSLLQQGCVEIDVLGPIHACEGGNNDPFETTISPQEYDLSPSLPERAVQVGGLFQGEAYTQCVLRRTRGMRFFAQTWDLLDGLPRTARWDMTLYFSPHLLKVGTWLRDLLQQFIDKQMTGDPSYPVLLQHLWRYDEDRQALIDACEGLRRASGECARDPNCAQYPIVLQGGPPIVRVKRSQPDIYSPQP